MRTYAPDYYTIFSCIAEKCKHNCCVGWEIDIDSNTYDMYKTIPGEFGNRLKQNIYTRDGNVAFRLGGDERCPFLNKNNLCEIILTLGEDKLCCICSDHPRFRNFFDQRVEIGLGLCCEEAARIVLSHKEKSKLIEIGHSDDEVMPEDEKIFFDIRDEIIEILQDREISLFHRIKKLISEFKLTFPEKSLFDWVNIFLSLEHLDEKWVMMLEELKNYNVEFSLLDKDKEISLEQLIVYFIYRHTPDSLYDTRLEERIMFSILSFYIIYALFEKQSDTLEEIVRMYSSEIEYSEENINILLKALGK